MPTLVPYSPAVGRVMFPRIASASHTFRAAAASATFWSSLMSSGTVTVKDFDADAPPELAVAVSVTVASPVPCAGRVTAPWADTVAGSEEDQV
ncbi:hypothetical protein ACHMXB_18635 [Arthrobacter sp. UC242_113]|uniref:hypothetical protein n=1 Tax=Arthrobacter sp. UC242_113 TaxID=3374550 RepID=UPI003756DB5D